MVQEAVFTNGPIATDRRTPRFTTKTSTSDGLTAGLVDNGDVHDGEVFVTVTSADANNIVTLPDAPVGTRVALINGGTGYELRTHAPATVGINGGTGSAAESAIGANVNTRCLRTTATNWVCTNFAAAGTVTATEVAAP